MATIKVLAGDFPKGNATFLVDVISFNWQPGDGWSLGKSLSIREIKSVVAASEEQVKKVFGSVAFGAIGALALGPIGLAAGLLAGGNRKEVTFIAEFHDGRKMLAVTDNKTYQKMLAVTF